MTTTTTTVAPTTIAPPDVRGIVGPLLPSLPGAAVAIKPAAAILPHLSPILRQRVQLLSSSSSNDPWIRLLSYDTTKAVQLAELARGNSFEPHPVSGEVEVDWDHEVETRYRRLDRETLQALVVLKEFGLFFRLVWCTGDKEGAGSDGNGWRVGEVSAVDQPSPFASFGGKATIAEAEREFEGNRSSSHLAPKTTGGAGRKLDSTPHSSNNKMEEDLDEEDDDDYWARYDATPARSPAVKRSPAPASTQSVSNVSNYWGAHNNTTNEGGADDQHYAQYDSVQPAMDNHDPDEEAALRAANIETPAPPLGLARPSTMNRRDGNNLDEVEPHNETNGVWTLAGPTSRRQSGAAADEDAERAERLLHPRPSSSAASSSGGSSMVAKLEESAGRREASEFGVKQHVSRSIKNLFLLARSAGIDREEFERLVKTELDVLGLMED